jgi:hypothetical protein
VREARGQLADGGEARRLEQLRLVVPQVAVRLLELLVAAAQVLQDAVVLDGVADRPLEDGGGDLALDQVVHRPRLHGLQVDGVIALPGEEDGGGPAAAGGQLADQVEPVARAEAVVHQADVEGVARPGQRAVESVGLDDGVARRPDLAEHLLREEPVILVVVDQQDPERHRAHIPRLPEGGRARGAAGVIRGPPPAGGGREA